MSYLTPFEELAARFERRARERSEETPADSGASTLTWAAVQLRETISTVVTGDIWWTTDRAATECNCSVAAVQYWCRNATRLNLRVIQKPSREYVIHRDDVMRIKHERERRKRA